MKTLDKTKPFGTVHGDSNGVCFEQDGVCFDASGHEHGAKAHTKEPNTAKEPKTADK